MTPHAGHQIAGESRQLLGNQTPLDQPVADRRVIAGIQVILIEHLKSHFTALGCVGSFG